MRQYTTPEQTAKLIKLGFEKPRALVDKYYDFDAETYAEVKAYSIGELIEMLPPKVGTWNLSIERYWEFEQWHVYYDPTTIFLTATELRDALYNCIVKLKEEGVI